MYIKSITLYCATLFISTSINATTLTFDDIPGGSIQDSSGFIQTYKGFTFTNNMFWVDVNSIDFNYGAVSGDFAALNTLNGAGAIREANDADFTFDGLWAKKWGTEANSGGLDSLFGTLAGYNNSVLVWEVTTGLNGSYEFYGPQAGVIDQVVLDLGNNFLVDDIVLNTVVPLPPAVWLFGSGLLGLIGVARGKKT